MTNQDKAEILDGTSKGDGIKTGVSFRASKFSVLPGTQSNSIKRAV
jgi:hypothetical protein